MVREEQEPVLAPANPFAELIVALMQGVAAVWIHLTGPPSQRLAQPQLPEAPRSRPTGEPSY